MVASMTTSFGISIKLNCIGQDHYMKL